MADISQIKLPNGDIFDLVDEKSGFVTTDTKNTAGSKQPGGSRPKLYLIGAMYQSAYAETYSYSDTYVDSDGSLHAFSALAIQQASNSYHGVFIPSNLTSNRIYYTPNKAGTIALTSDIPTVPVSTGSSTTGISIANHSTTSIYGVGSSTTSVTGVSGSTSIYGVKSGTNSTTTASKASGGNGTAPSWTFEEKSIPNVTAAGSGSLTFAMDGTDTKKLVITHTHTAPTLGTAISVQSKSGGSNGSASTWSFTDVTVPIRDDSATVVPTAASSATIVPIKDETATTVVTSETHSVTDNGHTHTI